MLKVLLALSISLASLIPASVLASTTTTDFRVFVTDGNKNTIHDLNAKASQGANGQVIPISGFVIDPEDVVLLHQGQNLVIMTSTNEPQRIDKVKIVNQAGQFIDLPQTTAGTWSLGGIVPGVYLLDVIVETPDSSSLVAYETVLVILESDQQPLPVTQYITMVHSVEVKTDVRIVFEEDEDEDRDGENGECIEDSGYLLSKGSYIDTENNAIVGSPCHPEEFCSDPDSDDPVVIDHCEDIWSDTDKLPICDENTPPGVTCIDEGDPDDCEPGFVDRGFGCEPEEPRICHGIANDPCGDGVWPPIIVEEEVPSPEVVDEDDTPEPEEIEEEGESDDEQEQEQEEDNETEEESNSEEESSEGEEEGEE
jgi:hypothetical protein